MLTEPSTQQLRHEEDWRSKKYDYSVFEGVRRYEFLKGLILSTNSEIILDVGCGSGYLAHLLKRERPSLEIHGCDIAEAALVQSREVLDVAYYLDLDRANLPEPNDKFDLVVCTEVLEHIYDVSRCVREIARVLKPGGFFIVTVPNLSFWRFRLEVLRGRIPSLIANELHIHAFNVSRLESLLRDYEFRITSVMGMRNRWPWLLRFSVELFTETIIIQATH